MKISKYLYMLPALAGLAIIGSLTAPKVAAAIKAAYVEIVVPDNPYNYTAFMGSFSGIRQTFGPWTGTLGLTSITLTNYSSQTTTVYVYSPADLNGATNCYQALPDILGSPNMNFTVPGNTTMHFPFPSPWVITPSPGSGHTCVTAEINGAATDYGVSIMVNGFVN